MAEETPEELPKQKGKCKFKVFVAIIFTTAILGGAFYLWYQYFSGIGEYEFKKTEEETEEEMEEEAVEEKVPQVTAPPFGEVEEEEAEESETEESETQVSNIFSVYDIKPGDQVGNMIVESIAPMDPNYSELSPENVIIEFSGEETVTGDYDFPPEGTAILGGKVAFSNLDEESLERIPLIENDMVPTHFYFSNQEFAEKELGPPGSKGTATVVIDNFTIIRYPSGGSPPAELVKVIERN